ncbi:MAG: hypothetical protein AAGA90_23200 [Actinomycetota bacterium]
MERARAAGRRLAERHGADGADPEPHGSLVNYAESPRADDWTLRSALVRLAQSQPQLVADLLQRVRRLDAALHQIARPLEPHTVVCDRGLTLDTVDGDPLDPYPDTRVADVLRLARSAGTEADVVIEAYIDACDISPEERAALPLLGVALWFDQLADHLVAWAQVAPAPAPVEAVEPQRDAE